MPYNEAGGAEGGRWLHPDSPAWDLWSADHAPNLSVFFSGEDATVFALGQELAHLVDAIGGDAHRYGFDLG
ncbi:hypothetical protein RCH23_003010 [Cryobacterium sp. CAN_C3]|uniref:hypothetical protein n=1 Tax=unclassified Cryobacterium TaxID=2649013 RepID=UPI0018CB8E21|nr:hypothetical protein [Cryobacterium sp. CAN_C3]MEC5155609.1 hypothetical protein [Cryobacterium sp. CAN_C3]